MAAKAADRFVLQRPDRSAPGRRWRVSVDGVTFDTHELTVDFADALGRVEDLLRESASQAVADSADEFVHLMVRNVEETAPHFSAPYRRSIDRDPVTSAEDTFVSKAGPDRSMPQGNMGTGFEYGSINQTSPHMDLHRAADSVEPTFENNAGDAGYHALHDSLAA